MENKEKNNNLLNQIPLNQLISENNKLLSESYISQSNENYEFAAQ